MSGKPIPRILITNDDGARGEGLKVLEQVARELSDDVWVVAPEFDQSGTSHSISLHEPLRLYTQGEQRHNVRGTPADCVMLAVGHLMKEAPPSLILSGVNRGANLSDAVAYSGTVGAAMSGILFDIPSIALSQAFREVENIRWDTAARLAPPLVLELYRRRWPEDVCLNINFPDIDADDVQGVAITHPARGSIAGVRVDARVDTRQQPYFWLGFDYSSQQMRDPGTDVACLRDGKVSISPMRFERDTRGEWGDLGTGLGECLRGA